MNTRHIMTPDGRRTSEREPFLNRFNVEHRRFMFGSAIYLYSLYLLSATIIIHHSNEIGALLSIFGVIAILPSLMLLVPQSKSIQDNFLREGSGVISGFITISVLGLVLFTIYSSYQPFNAWAGVVIVCAVIALSLTAMILTIYYMIKSLPRYTIADIVSIIWWTIILYIGQLIFVVVTLFVLFLFGGSFVI